MEVKFTTNDPKDKLSISLTDVHNFMCIRNLVTVISWKKKWKKDSEIHCIIKVIILLQERYQVVDIDKLLFVVNFWACHGELTTAAVKYDEYCAKNIEY